MTLLVKQIKTIEDVQPLQLREADLFEIEAGGFDSAEACVQHCLNGSDQAFACWWQDRLVALWGWRPSSLLGEYAEMWCLTGPAADEVPLLVAKASHVVVRHFLERMPEIRVLCHEKHRVAHSWLHWLGFVDFSTKDGFIEMRRTRTWAS